MLLNVYNLIFLQACPGAGGQGGGWESMLGSMLPFLLIIVVFYFLILRPQQKRQKERQRLLESIRKGDKVVTASGIIGTVEGIEDKEILLKVAENVKIKMLRSAVTEIVGITDRLASK